MKITNLKITYINGDTETIEIGKKWVAWSRDNAVLVLEGISNSVKPCKVIKQIPFTSILHFISEENNGS